VRSGTGENLSVFSHLRFQKQYGPENKVSAFSDRGCAWQGEEVLLPARKQFLSISDIKRERMCENVCVSQAVCM